VNGQANGSSELRRLASLTFTLAITDFKQRYYGNFLGYFWTLARPLMLFGVLYVAFTQILSRGATPYFAQTLITGLVLYTYFSETTGQGLTSLVGHEPLIRKVPVPLLVIPLAIALRAFFTLALNLVAVGVFLAAGDVPVTATWLAFPLLLGVLLVYSAAVGALLADLYVPFRDLSSIWEIGLQLMFWGSPIIYPIESVPEGFLRDLILCNPLADIIAETRHVLIDPNAPSVTEAMSNPALIAVPIAIAFAVLAASILLYRWITPRIAEQL
jgi:ABC-2 type transport system permease protein